MTKKSKAEQVEEKVQDAAPLPNRRNRWKAPTLPVSPRKKS